jgi:hypothetical protein
MPLEGASASAPFLPPPLHFVVTVAVLIGLGGILLALFGTAPTMALFRAVGLWIFVATVHEMACAAVASAVGFRIVCFSVVAAQYLSRPAVLAL